MATRWRPDTCRCVFDVDDWDAPIATAVRTCPFHEGLSGAAHIDAVLNGENRAKNYALGHLEAVAPHLFDENGPKIGAVAVAFGQANGAAREVLIDCFPPLSGPQRAVLAQRIRHGRVTVR